jgi:hypothetical protein
MGTLGFAGVMDIEDRVARFTQKLVYPEILRWVAVMAVVPDATAVTRPLPSTVATDVSDEFQVTCVVISWVVPSEYVPKAVSCSVISAGTFGLAGVTYMETTPDVDPPDPVSVPPPHPTKMRKSTSRITENKSFVLIIPSSYPIRAVPLWPPALLEIPWPYSRGFSETSLCASYPPLSFMASPLLGERIPLWHLDLFRSAKIMPGEIHLNLCRFSLVL